MISHILNMAPIVLYYKKYFMVETRVLSNEFVAMKQVMDALCGFCKKQCIVVVDIEDNPSYVYVDSMPAIHNMQTPEYTLKKQSYSVCYYAVFEDVDT